MKVREMTLIRTIATLIVLAGVVPATAQTSRNSKPQFPIFINGLKELRSSGLTLAHGGGRTRDFPHLKHRCYAYGDGGYMISINDAFLKNYTDRGFSLNSMCMGLMSGIRFDPETGDHLPTYIVVAPKKRAEALRHSRRNCHLDCRIASKTVHPIPSAG